MSPIARPGDFWSAAALAALGAYSVVESTGWVYMGADGPGAGFFPLWYGIAMVALSFWLVLHSVGRRATEATTLWHDARRPLACWVAFMVSVALLKLAGFFVAFTLLTWFVIAVMFRRSQRMAWTLALAGAAVFELVFDVALGVSLPAGMWP